MLAAAVSKHSPFGNKQLLPEPDIRLRVESQGQQISVAMPVLLTGGYDCYARSATGHARGKIAAVELVVGRDAHGQDIIRWLKLALPPSFNPRGEMNLGGLENAYGEPLTYRELRRALLLIWMNDSYPFKRSSLARSELSNVE